MHKLARIISILMAAAFLIAVTLLIKTLYNSYGQKKKADELRSMYENSGIQLAEPDSANIPKYSMAEEETGDWSRGMLEINSDYFGWLTVFETQVNYPVAQGKDNSYYLSHDFFGKKNSYGSLFLDSGNDLAVDGNLLIYGHYMKDGQIFGSLKEFKNADFFAENGLVRLETKSDTYFYQIFALLILPGSAEADDYLTLQGYMNELNEETTAEMLKTLKSRAYRYKDLAIENDDKFLFLVTCDYSRTNGRLLLCAKRL